MRNENGLPETFGAQEVAEGSSLEWHVAISGQGSQRCSLMTAVDLGSFD